MLKLTDEGLAALEDMIDHADLSAVIDALAHICASKADHIETNWSDHVTAKAWERAAIRLTEVAHSVVIRGTGVCDEV